MRVWHRFIRPISSFFRRKRGKFIFDTFPDIATLRICDIGGSRHFWENSGIPGIKNRNITIFNISDAEAKTMHREHEDEINVVVYDGKKIPVADGEYDLLVCNSVLEHVPPKDRLALAREMRRVAKRIFIQTPAYSFPIEPHFIMPFVHWLPRTLGFALIHISPWRLLSRPAPETIARYWWDTQLLGEKEIRALFPGKPLIREKVFGVTKSYYVI